jgi:hypothetical protein
MYQELRQYLLLNRQLNLPGVGTIIIERKAAEADFASKLIMPPTYSIALHHGAAGSNSKLFSWLSGALQISESDAAFRYDEFARSIKNEVLNGERLQWEGIGVLTKGLAGEIRFEPALVDTIREQPVVANKVLRENAEHTVRVGEEEKTSSQMIHLLTLGQGKKSKWWVAALILLVLSLVFVIYYFTSNGFNPSSAGNQQKITPTSPQ